MPEVVFANGSWQFWRRGDFKGCTNMTLRLASAAVAVAVLGLAPPAAADILKAFTFGLEAVNSTKSNVPLNGASATSVSFNVAGSSNKRIAITYSATCAAGGSASGFIDIDIEVDGNEISPTDTSGETFCQGDATAGADTFVRATIIGVKTLAPGQHTVEVFAEPLGGASSWQVGLSTLLTQD